MTNEDFSTLYDDAYKAAQKAGGPETKKALFLLLQLISGLRSDAQQNKEAGVQS